MKKLAMIVSMMMLAACPVACVNYQLQVMKFLPTGKRQQRLLSMEQLQKLQ